MKLQPPGSAMAPLPSSFISKKAAILSALSLPIGAYNDLSPKGTVDEGIRDLIDEINAVEGFVTTSSCAGRVSVFAEGVKRKIAVDDETEVENDQEVGEDGGDSKGKLAGVGGKGGGGRWLFVSHEPVVADGVIVGRFGMMVADAGEEEKAFHGERLVHFKFEPMILHILTASLSHAQLIISAALQAGFRESGALNLTAVSKDVATPMVAVRSMGLCLESVIGYVSTENNGICVVSEGYLKRLLVIANERFEENSKRIQRFRSFMAIAVERDRKKDGRKNKNGEEWEDKERRRERKKAEGLKISQQLQASASYDETAQTDTL